MHDPVNWRHFPSEYIDVFMRAAEAGHWKSPPLTSKRADTVRRAFYRFRDALKKSPDRKDIGPNETSRLYHLLAALTVSKDVHIEGWHRSGFYIVSLVTDPLIAIARKENPVFQEIADNLKKPIDHEQIAATNSKRADDLWNAFKEEKDT